jgi:4-hydroxybenzoyl-CoA reductase beta subunit
MTTMNAFEYFRPQSLAEASAVLLEGGRRAALLAGGTDLLVRAKRQLRPLDVVIDLNGLPELHRVEAGPEGLTVGALVTPAVLAQQETVRLHFPALAQAAASVGGMQVRNMATLGGALCGGLRCQYRDQSPFWRHAVGACAGAGGRGCLAHPGDRCQATVAHDLHPALLVHHGQVLVQGAEGRRRISLEQYRRSERNPSLEADEVVTGVLLPWPARDVTHLAAYEKARLRRAVDRPLVGLAVAVEQDDRGEVRQLRLAACGNGPEVRLLPEASLFEGTHLDTNVIEAIVRSTGRWFQPSPALRIDPHWRRLMAGALSRRALTRLAAPGPRDVDHERHEEAPWQRDLSPIH